MGYGFSLKITGDYALFTRPEMKIERVSYDVITPSAARGVIEAIYFKPAIRYVIDKIHVYNEPRFTNIRRNEVTKKISDGKKLLEGKNARGYIAASECICQRASTILTNVTYIIEAHFEMTGKNSEKDDECEKKHYNIILRRLRNGQCFHTPYLGCREFPAKFEIVENEIPESTLSGTKDLGYMLYDMDFSNLENITPMFFKCEMVNGVIDLTNVRIVR